MAVRIRQTFVQALEARVLLSNWYVSGSAGNNGNAGTLAAPFATIQKAATVVRPGDTVLIRAGTYRETVIPARSGTASAPITFKPYNNETVTISGADVVTGWSRHTFVGDKASVKGGARRDMAGTEFRNNVFVGVAEMGSAAAQSNNVGPGADPLFANRARGDFRLKAGSPAIDRGAVLPPYTDGYAGARPDAGAFESGRTTWTGGADARAAGPDKSPPPVVSSLAAKASAAGVALDWADRLVRDRAFYNVFASSSRTGPFKRLNNEPLRSSEYLDRAAPSGTTRYYYVTVVDTSGNASAASRVVPATRPRDSAPPATVPAKLKAPAPSGTHVDLTWLALGDASSCRIERRGPGDAAFVEIARGVVATRYGIDALRPGASYKFRVRGENSLGASSRTSTVTITTPAVPAAPSNVKARRVSTTQVDVSFSAVAGATTYSVERRADGSLRWVVIRTLAATATSFSDANLPAGKRYSYRIRSVGPGGASAYGVIATA